MKNPIEEAKDTKNNDRGAIKRLIRPLMSHSIVLATCLGYARPI